MIESLRSAFEIEFEDMISSVLRGEKPTNAERCQKPLAPVFFASQDNMIVWDPGEVEASWRDVRRIASTRWESRKKTKEYNI